LFADKLADDVDQGVVSVLTSALGLERDGHLLGQGDTRHG